VRRGKHFQAYHSKGTARNISVHVLLNQLMSLLHGSAESRQQLQAAALALWVYSYKFTGRAVHNVHCTSPGHAPAGLHWLLNLCS
jgi:hypothetical protein